MKRLFGSILLIFIFNSVAKAQYYQTGQDPSQVHWRQFNTANFQIVFPEEFDLEAQRMLYVLQKVYDYGSFSLNYKPRKISVVLHTKTVKSNGMLAWAPKRIELFTTPHQKIYAQDWIEQLALHEFRHFVQMDKIQAEMPFLLKMLLGEQAAAIVTGAYLPLWFLEGDAVVTETSLSHAGRGRMASFEMEHVAQLTEKGKFSFDKAYLGSYRDFVPDHYKMGYWMVSKSREKYGSKIWSDALMKIGKKPFSLSPVQSAIKQNTGLNTKQLYNQIFDSLEFEWKHRLNATPQDFSSLYSPKKKSYTNYLYPSHYQDSLIIAYRTSMDDIGRFVLIQPDMTEKILYTPGSILDESVSVINQLIIWAERRADLRWEHADKSVIRIFNIETKTNREFSFENKLFSPVISPNLKSFAAVEIDQENRVYLSVFDLITGKLIKRFGTDDNQYLISPCWDREGAALFTVCLSSQGKYLASIDLQSGIFQKITETTYANLKNPEFVNDQLIFSADFSGKDNLYSIDLKTRKINLFHESRFGTNYPSAINSKNQILFSNYTSGGYQIASKNINDRSTFPEISDIQLKTNRLAEKIALQEMGIPDLSFKNTMQVLPSNYSKFRHLFNFHSWSPAYIDIANTNIKPGISFFSQNLLGTAETKFGYDYNIADHTGKIKLDFNYSGLFPVFHTSFSYGSEASKYLLIKNTTNQYNQVIRSDTTIQKFTWDETTADLDVSLPFNLSKGKYSVMLFPEVKYSFNQVSHHSSTPENFYTGHYNALSYRLYWVHLLRQSEQNLMSRWGQQIDLIYRHTPFGGNDLGSLSGLQSILYFPGIGRNHGIRIYQAYQKKVLAKNSSFANVARFPRGIQSYQNNQMYSLATDYKLPLFYPDLSLGRWCYLKRIKSSVFYDYARLSVPLYDQKKQIIPNHHQLELSSVGLELTSDLHFMRFFAPVEIGVRSIYLPDLKSFQFEFLFSVDFKGF